MMRRVCTSTLRLKVEADVFLVTLTMPCQTPSVRRGQVHDATVVTDFGSDIQDSTY